MWYLYRMKEDEMAQATLPGIDLAIGAKGEAWHVVTQRNPHAAKVKTQCGRYVEPTAFEVDVDARAVSHKGVKVCAACRTRLVAAGNGDASNHEEDNPMSTTATPRRGRRRAATPVRPAQAPIGKKALDDAIAKVARLRASTPELTAELTPKRAEHERHLAKMISADAYFLGRMSPDAAAATVKKKVARIEERVRERNALRTGK